MNGDIRQFKNVIWGATVLYIYAGSILLIIIICLLFLTLHRLFHSNPSFFPVLFLLSSFINHLYDNFFLNLMRNLRFLQQHRMSDFPQMVPSGFRVCWHGYGWRVSASHLNSIFYSKQNLPSISFKIMGWACRPYLYYS